MGENIDANEIGEKVLRLEMEHAEAIEYVREICLDSGFGIPVEFSPSELLNEKVDANRDPLYVLGACNPAIADQALEETLDIAALFPCNMIIREVEPGVQEVHHVSIMRIARLVGMAPDSESWQAIIAETGELTENTFATLQANQASD